MSGGGMMRCHYEVLGLEMGCSDDEIKKAYRKAALKWHPDKNHGNEEEAERQFKDVSRAYTTLSDPQERAWYDAHRDSILRGGDGTADGDDEDDGAQGTDCGVALHSFFDRSCFEGFEYRSDERDFFSVFAALFEQIAREEFDGPDAPVEGRGGGRNDEGLPPFGTQHARWETVSSFYAHWSSFGSRRTFAFADKWHLPTAPNRQVKRLMEKDNKKAREKQRKRRNSEVRALVAWMKLRDPRVKAHKAEVEREKEQREADAERRRQEERDAHAMLEREWRERRTAELRAEEEAIAAGEMERADAWLDEDLGGEGSGGKGKRGRRGMREGGGAGEGDSDDEGVGDDEESDQDAVEVVLECVACNKVFKTEGQLSNHQKSKKHRQAVQKLCRQLESEDALVRDMEQKANFADATEGAGLGGASTDDDNVDKAEGLRDGRARSRVLPEERINTEGVAGTGGGLDGDDHDNADLPLDGLGAGLGGLGGTLGVENDDDDFDWKKPSRGKGKKGKRRGGGVGASGPAFPKEQPQPPAADGGQEEEGEVGEAGIKIEDYVSSGKKKGKGKKKKGQAAAAGAGTRKGGNAKQNRTKCNVCGEEFDSRSKLFKHIEATGHALRA